MRYVQVRVFRGKELSYAKNGKVKNENHSMKLTPREWMKFLKNAMAHGFCDIKLERVFNWKNNVATEVDEQEFNLVKAELEEKYTPYDEFEEQESALIDSKDKAEREKKAMKQENAEMKSRLERLEQAVENAGKVSAEAQKIEPKSGLVEKKTDSISVDMKKDDLLRIAREKGLEANKTMTKKQIIDIINK